MPSTDNAHAQLVGTLKVGEEGSQLVGRDDYTIGRKLRLNVSQGAAVTISPCGLERLQHHVWCQLKHAY